MSANISPEQREALRKALFRKEVIDHEDNPSEAVIMLTAAPHSWAALLLLFAIFLAAVIFLFTASYTYSVRVNGALTPISGISQIVAPSSGYVALIDAREGDQVEIGAPLAQIVSERAAANRQYRRAGEAVVNEKLSAFDSEVARQKLARQNQERSLKNNLLLAREQIALVQAQISAQATRVETLKRQHERFVELKERGFISAIQLEEKRDALDVEIEKSRTVQYSLSVAQQKVADLVDEAALAQVQNAEQLDVLQAKRRSLVYEKESFFSDNEVRVHSPVKGIVFALATQPNQYVERGQLVMSIAASDTRYHATLLISAAQIGLVKQGDGVVMRISAFAPEKYGYLKGRVLAVSQAPLSVAEAMYDGAKERGGSNEERVYRVLVDVDDQSFLLRNPGLTLRAGLQLQADVLLEKRKLIQWLFSILYSLF